MRIAVLACAALAAGALAGRANAVGGSYAFRGGTPAEQAQVRAALDASSFDWSVIPRRVTVVIARGAAPSATAGTVVLDASLLDTGRFAWGVVQHEFAHEVDFFVLDDADRAVLADALGGAAWWPAGPALEHGSLTCERFATTLAWAYWPSADNVMRPESIADEGGDVAPATFRALLDGLLAAQQDSPISTR
ncbi:MAG TPA: hypothetical protein VFA30_10840 [Gaiellaceae bacterium]|nr:hypothetical protein [Gaiellaceae bacterium]